MRKNYYSSKRDKRTTIALKEMNSTEEPTAGGTLI